MRDTRGVSIVFVAITIVASMAAVALAIDIGMLLNARTEAQRAADSAALAGA
ncbi:MAG: pilus assembly protein TadG-related protein, partial [Gemmatimonadota bacterium]